MAEAVAEAGVVFRLLLVCSGNVCRSPLAERLLRTRLAAGLGAAADRFEVTSAGTEAEPGTPMDERAAAVARSLGADPDGFGSRPLSAELVAGADLVLTAARQHRAAVVRLHPPAHRYAFTMREFARLVAAIPADRRPAGGDPLARATDLVAQARARRGFVRPRRPEDDDIPDPYGTVDRVHQTVGGVIVASLAGLLDVLCDIGSGANQPAVRAPRRRVPWPARRRSRPPRVWARIAIATGLAVLAAVGWIAVRGLAAQRQLTAAEGDLATVRSALLAGDPDRARVALDDARRRTARAHALTGDPLWRLAGLPPYLGNTPRAVRTVAAAVDAVTSRALPRLVDAGATLAPERLRLSGDRVAVDAFVEARPEIDAAAAEIAVARARLDDLDAAWLPGPVASAVRDVRTGLATAASTLDGVGRATRLVPAMLGAGGTRRYLMVFQNSAEARGTGGLPGLYAVLAANRGRIRVERLGSNTDLRGADRLPVNLGAEYTAQWGQDPALWPNSNLDPRFPAAARIWLALWRQQTGQRLDGAIATDPVAVSYLLRAAGQVRLPTGERLDAGNVARLTMSEVYQRFPGNQAQNAFLRTVARTAIEALLSGRGRPRPLLDGLTRAARERRLLVYSTHAADEDDLSATALGGTLPDAAGPYAFVVVNNLAGSKMDYYLQRAVSYSSGRCVGGDQSSRVTLRFGNAAPPADRLPDYVTQRGDTTAGTVNQSVARGSLSLLVSVYGPRGAGVLRSTMDGRPLPVTSYMVDGRPVWGFPLVVPPGTWRTVVLDLSEPASGATPVVPVQPLVRPQVVRVSAATCG